MTPAPQCRLVIAFYPRRWPPVRRLDTTCTPSYRQGMVGCRYQIVWWSGYRKIVWIGDQYPSFRWRLTVGPIEIRRWR